MRESLIGQVFDRLTVIEQSVSDKRGKRQWVCKCSCGNLNYIIARTETLKAGQTKSCGCLRNEKSKDRLTKHGLRYHHLYKTWLNMRNRCNNSKGKNWDTYGGRGISVCKEWNDFSVFLSDMGEKEDDSFSLERVDGDGNYCKENCVWAKSTQQARNVSKKSNNTSGITGVHFTSVNKGLYTYQDWIATWNDITGKSKRKTFSVSKYGEVEAKKMAIVFRESKIKELNEQGAGYTIRHGT